MTSRDQLCLSATMRGPEGTTRVKVLSHNPREAYEHTSTSTLPQVLGLHDHTWSYTTIRASTKQKWAHTTSVDSHDQMLRSTRPYTAESSLEKIQGFPELTKNQSTTNPNAFLNRRDIRSNGRIMTEYSGDY